MKTIYKTTFVIEVLSEQPLPENVSLHMIEYETEDGDWLLSGKRVDTKEELSGRQAVEAILEAGSQPEFFQMDDEGNELDEEELDDDTPDFIDKQIETGDFNDYYREHI